MGADTGIEWCDATFNSWTGCTKISPACDHCYAETQAKRAPRTFGGWNCFGNNGSVFLASREAAEEVIRAAGHEPGPVRDEPNEEMISDQPTNP